MKRTPSTINLSLVAIANWLDFNGQNMPMPSNVEELRSAPQGLDRLSQRSLTRAVKRESSPRDIALITLMRNTGLRISEVAFGYKRSQHGGSFWESQGKNRERRKIPHCTPQRRYPEGLARLFERRANGPVFLSQRGK